MIEKRIEQIEELTERISTFIDSRRDLITQAKLSLNELDITGSKKRAYTQKLEDLKAFKFDRRISFSPPQTSSMLDEGEFRPLAPTNSDGDFMYVPDQGYQPENAITINGVLESEREPLTSFWLCSCDECTSLRLAQIRGEHDDFLEGGDHENRQHRLRLRDIRINSDFDDTNCEDWYLDDIGVSRDDYSALHQLPPRAERIGERTLVSHQHIVNRGLSNMVGSNPFSDLIYSELAREMSEVMLTGNHTAIIPVNGIESSLGTTLTVDDMDLINGIYPATDNGTTTDQNGV